MRLLDEKGTLEREREELAFWKSLHEKTFTFQSGIVLGKDLTGLRRVYLWNRLSKGHLVIRFYLVENPENPHVFVAALAVGFPTLNQTLIYCKITETLRIMSFDVYRRVLLEHQVKIYSPSEVRFDE